MIKTKTEMYELLIRGVFGNRFRIWNTEEEYADAIRNGFDWLVGVRCVGVPGLPYYHHKTYDEAIEIGARLKKQYRCPVCYYEASPDQHITIQGEIRDYPFGYGVEYSTIKTHMRAAFAQERLSDFGLHMPVVVRQFFNESSLEDLYWVFDQHPGSVYEFTAYDILVGELPGRNVVCWEVRNY